MQQSEKTKKPDTKTQQRTVARLARQAAQVPSGCKACGRKGLPVLPLRVAAVPTGTAGNMWRPEVPEPPVTLSGGEYKYALRTLRMGYLYVLLDRDIWQAYEVTEEGYLRQFDPLVVPEGETVAPLSPACLNAGHHVQSSFISIDTEQFSEAWLAFSGDPWSLEVLEGYRTGSRPASRFTQVNLKAGGETAAVKTLDRTLSALKSGVVEFATDFYPSPVTGAKPGGAHGFYGRQQDELRYSAYVETLQRSNGRVLAIVLEDSVGVVQELNNGRLELVEARQKYVEQPKNIHRYTIASTINDAMQQMKRAIAENSKARIERPVSGYPAGQVLSVTTKEEVAENIWSARYARLVKSFNEPERAAFVSEYQEKIARWTSRIEGTGRDLAGWYLSRSWLTAVTQDYDTKDGLLHWAKQHATLATCLQGGATDKDTDAVWKAWLAKPDSPAYQGLMGTQQDLLAGVFAGVSGYSYLKTVLSADEISAVLESPAIQAHFAARYASLHGSVSRVMTQLDEAAKEGLTRLVQGSLRVSAGREVTLFTLDTTLEEAQKYMRAGLAELALAENKSAFTETYRSGGRTVSTSPSVLFQSIKDPEILSRRVTLHFTTDVPLEQFEKQLRQSDTSVAAVQRQPITDPSKLALFPDLKLSRLTLHGNLEQMTMSVSKAHVQDMLAERTRRFVSGQGMGMALSSGMLILQVLDFYKKYKSMRDAVGNDTDETLQLLFTTMMITSALAEVAGFGRNLILKRFWEKAPQGYVHPLIRAGGVIAGLASVVDGIRMAKLAWDTFKLGEAEAAKLYRSASISTILGGLITTWGAYAGVFSLFGFIGLGAIFFIIGGILASHAERLNSTPFEVWLRKTCFGISRKNEVRAREDSIEDLNLSLTSLNAILGGMMVELGFDGTTDTTKVNSNGVIFELETGPRFARLEMRMLLPGGSETESAWQYMLTLHDKVTGSVVLRAESHNIPDKANISHGYASGFDRPDRVTLTQKENDLEIRGSFWVNCSYGSRVTLDVNYWPHKGDRQYQLAQTLNTER